MFIVDAVTSLENLCGTSLHMSSTIQALACSICALHCYIHRSSFFFFLLGFFVKKNCIYHHHLSINVITNNKIFYGRMPCWSWLEKPTMHKHFNSSFHIIFWNSSFLDIIIIIRLWQWSVEMNFAPCSSISKHQQAAAYQKTSEDEDWRYSVHVWIMIYRVRQAKRIICKKMSIVLITMRCLIKK